MVPTIYLITGPNRCGKSQLAHKLQGYLGARVISQSEPLKVMFYQLTGQDWDLCDKKLYRELMITMAETWVKPYIGKQFFVAKAWSSIFNHTNGNDLITHHCNEFIIDDLRFPEEFDYWDYLAELGLIHRVLISLDSHKDRAFNIVSPSLRGGSLSEAGRSAAREVLELLIKNKVD